jgi:small subunit ribosomal protein S5
LTDSGLIEKVVSINRVSKTTKGGTRLAFSALVVVGDGKGKVGYGLGKAGEVATGIKKALAAAKKQMIFIPRRGTTITHEIIGRCGSAIVLLKPASDGTGVIASGAVRAVCDGAGITNVLTKCHRSNNPINVVKATFDGLSRLKAIRKAVETTSEVAHASTPVTKP